MAAPSFVLNLADKLGGPRLERERRTMTAMVEVYCRQRHGTTDDLCWRCRGLADYAELRLARCPFQEEKPTCAKCPIHCYRREPRQQMHQVMRTAGPRILLHRPVLALLHLLDGKRPVPELPHRGHGSTAASQ